MAKQNDKILTVLLVCEAEVLKLLCHQFWVFDKKSFCILQLLLPPVLTGLINHCLASRSL
jgi:hypothetical protein